MKRSLRDYTIYFLTLLFGISIFYMFTALGSQSILSQLFKLSEAAQKTKGVDPLTAELFSGLENLMNYVSVFVAVILGFLVVYANTFMIRRRKKEFGVYLTLGMKGITISGILVCETFMIGIVSLVAGIALGVLLSQLMSVFVVQMFGMEAEGTTFIFSADAMVKTIICFGIVFVVTLFVNLISVSGSRLIRLLNAEHRAKTIKVKRPVISIVLFAAGVILLIGGFAFTEIQFQIIGRSVKFLGYLTALIPVIIVSVLLIIVSLSGFLLSLLSFSEKIRFKGLNVFVIKQLGSKIYSAVFSMAITTLILSVVLTAISASLSFTVAERAQMEKNYPVDLVVERLQTAESAGAENNSLYDEMKAAGFDMSMLSEYSEFAAHITSDVEAKMFFSKEDYDELKDAHKLEVYDLEQDSEPFEYEEFFSYRVQVLYESDYNKLAKLYHLNEMDLADDEYGFMCSADGYKEIMQRKLSEGHKITIVGKEYHPGKNSFADSNFYPSFTAINTGVLIIADGSRIYSNEFAGKLGTLKEVFLAANYDKSKKSGKEINRMFNGGFDMVDTGVFGYFDNVSNEYYNTWEKLRMTGSSGIRDEKVKELTEGMNVIYDSSGPLAYYKEGESALWTVNEDKTELVPLKDKIDMKALWIYNRKYLCQIAYVDGYTEHVSETGYPLAYEDKDGKFYVNSLPCNTITSDGKFADAVGGLEPMESEFKPERDFIYDRNDDCIYELLPNGEKKRMELSETEDFLRGEDFFGVEAGEPSYLMYTAFSRINDVELSIESSSCLLFVVLYVGMVFLMACAAVLGLKQLSDSADNKLRYTTLRQIGCSEKMIDSAFFKQIVLLFLLPLVLALIISSVLLTYIVRMIGFYLVGGILIRSIVITLVVLAAIYVSFFIVTWLGCRRMIHDGAKPEQIN